MVETVKVVLASNTNNNLIFYGNSFFIDSRLTISTFMVTIGVDWVIIAVKTLWHKSHLSLIFFFKKFLILRILHIFLDSSSCILSFFCSNRPSSFTFSLSLWALLRLYFWLAALFCSVAICFLILLSSALERLLVSAGISGII